jgi:hypothetical protein
MSGAAGGDQIGPLRGAHSWPCSLSDEERRQPGPPGTADRASNGLRRRPPGPRGPRSARCSTMCCHTPQAFGLRSAPGVSACGRLPSWQWSSPRCSENTPEYELVGRLGSHGPARRIQAASHVSDYPFGAPMEMPTSLAIASCMAFNLSGSNRTLPTLSSTIWACSR